MSKALLDDESLLPTIDQIVERMGKDVYVVIEPSIDRFVQVYFEEL